MKATSHNKETLYIYSPIHFFLHWFMNIVHTPDLFSHTMEIF